MSKPEPTHPEEQFAHVDRQQDRDPSDAEATYAILVYSEGREYVATQPDATLEARGFSAAEAIANYARAVDAKNNGETVIPDE